MEFDPDFREFWAEARDEAALERADLRRELEAEEHEVYLVEDEIPIDTSDFLSSPVEDDESDIPF